MRCVNLLSAAINWSLEPGCWVDEKYYLEPSARCSNRDVTVAVESGLAALLLIVVNIIYDVV